MTTPYGYSAFAQDTHRQKPVSFFGDGPTDVLFLTSWLSNVDVMWDD